MKHRAKGKSSGIRKPLADTTNRMKQNREAPKLKSHNQEFAKQVISQQGQTSTDSPSTHNASFQEPSNQSGDFEQMEHNREPATGSDIEMTEEPSALVDQEQNRQQKELVAASTFQSTEEPPNPLVSYNQSRSAGRPVRHSKKGGLKPFDPSSRAGRNTQSNDVIDETRVEVSSRLELNLAEVKTAPTVVVDDAQQSYQYTLEGAASVEINDSSSEPTLHVSQTECIQNAPALPTLQPSPQILEAADRWKDLWATSACHEGTFKPLWTKKQAPGLDETLSNQARARLFKSNQMENFDRLLKDAKLEDWDRWLDEYECTWVAILFGWPSWKFMTRDEQEMAWVAAGDDDDDKSWAPDMTAKSHDDRMKMFEERRKHQACKAIPETMLDAICEMICFQWGWPHPQTLTVAERAILQSSEEVRRLLQKHLKARVKRWETVFLKTRASVGQLKGSISASMAEYCAYCRDHNIEYGQYNGLKKQLDACKPIWWDNARWDRSNKTRILPNELKRLLELAGRTDDALKAVNDALLPMLECKDASEKLSRAHSAAQSELTQLQAEQLEIAKEAQSNGIAWKDISSLKEEDIKPATKVGANKRKRESEEVVEAPPAAIITKDVVSGTDVLPNHNIISEEVSARISKKQKTVNSTGVVIDVSKQSEDAAISVEAKATDVPEQSDGVPNLHPGEEKAADVPMQSKDAVLVENETKNAMAQLKAIPGLGLSEEDATEASEQSKAVPSRDEGNVIQTSDEGSDTTQIVTRGRTSPPLPTSLVPEQTVALSEQGMSNNPSQLAVSGQNDSPVQHQTVAPESKILRAVGRTPAGPPFQQKDLIILQELQGIIVHVPNMVPSSDNKSEHRAFERLQKGKRRHNTFSDEYGWSAETKSNKVFLSHNLNDSQRIKRIHTDFEMECLNTTHTDSNHGARMTTMRSRQTTWSNRRMHTLGNRVQQQMNHDGVRYDINPFQVVPSLPGPDEDDLIE